MIDSINDNESIYWDQIIKQLQIIDYQFEIKCKNFMIHILLNNFDYIKTHSYDIYTKDEKQLCYYVACMFSDDKDIIEFLISEFDININDKLYSTNFNLIDFSTADGYSGFEFACNHNKNLFIIKYLFEKYDAINFDKCRINLWLKYLCRINTNFETICYLLREWNEYQNHNYLFEFLTNTRYIEPNITQIMYLVENVKIKTSDDSTDELCCLVASLNKNLDDDIKLYLLRIATCEKIKESTVKLTMIILIRDIIRLLDFISTKDFIKLNVVLEKLYDEIESTVYENYKVIIRSELNPILLNANNREKCGIADPFAFEFKYFTSLVDKVFCRIDIPKKIQSKETNDIHSLNPSESNQILFCHNNKPYYGNRSIIYNSMTFINDILDCTNFDQSFTLNVDIPEYCVDLYINAIYDKSFDIHKIKPTDFYNFISFIDRYPTTITSIDFLEDQIIDYIETHGIEFNEQMINIIMRYRLKNMYLYLHNKKIRTAD